MKRIILSLLLLGLFAVNAEASNYWWDPSGTRSSCVGGASSTAPVTAAGYFGNVSGSNLQGLLNCLGSGDTGYMRAGTYSGAAVSFTPPTSASFAAAASLRNYNGEAAIFKPTGSNGTGFTIQRGGDYFILSGIDFDGASMNDANSSSAFDIKSDHVKVENSNIHNWDGQAIGLRFNTGGWVIGNHIHHNSATLALCGHGVEHGCHGIYAAAVNFIIEDNVFDNHLSGADIQLYGYLAATFPTECATLLCDNHGAIIRNNSMSGSYRCLFLGNDDALIYNNICYGGLDIAVQILADDANTGTPKLYNNTIYGAASISILLNFGGQAVISNNILRSNGTDAIDATGGSYTGATNLIGTNPLFVDAVNHDFRLQAGSPALNTGTNLATVLGCTSGTTCTDFDGTIRPQNTLWDIGAFESGSGGGGPSCPSPALVASYALTSNANDGSGNANHGTATGVTIPATGYSEGALFPGSAAITIPHSSSLYLPCGGTLELWFRATSPLTTWTGLIATNYNPLDGIYLYAGSADVAGAGAPLAGYFAAGFPNSFAYGTLLTSGVWVHLALTINNTLASNSQKLFINSVHVTSGSGTATLADWTGNLYFGGTPFGEYLRSGDMIARPKIYNYARSPSEIATDMGMEPVPSTPTAPAALRMGTGSNALKCGTGSGACKVGLAQ